MSQVRSTEDKIMKKEKKSKKKLIIIIAAVLVLSCIAAAISDDEEDPGTQEPQTAEQEITTPNRTEKNQEPETQEPMSDNPLMAAEVLVGDVMNGIRTEKLWEWAKVSITKETLKSITQEQFSEFCHSRVEGSGYNWYAISCEDGTGIQFAGSISYVATYGTLDSDGCIVESAGTIMILEDGSYSYTEAE